MAANADRLIELFHAAKSRAAGIERDTFLREACRGDTSLEHQVRSLLVDHPRVTNYQQTPVPRIVVPMLIEKPKDQLWRYRLSLAAGAALVVALTLGLAFSTRKTREALRAQEEANRLRLQAEQHLYAADMLRAYEALARGQLRFSRALLTQYSSGSRNRDPLSPDLRGWEWRHLWSRTRGDDMAVLAGHSNEVPSVLFLNDGQRLFSASHDGTLRFWDIESGETLATLDYPFKPRRPSISSNGDWIAVDGAEGQWCVLDARQRRFLHPPTAHDHPVLATAFSPDDRLLAVAATDLIRIVDTATWQTLYSISKGDPAASDRSASPVAFSPAGDRLAYSHTDRRIIVRLLATGTEVTVGRSARGEAMSLCFTWDGRFLVSGDRERLSVWEVARPGQVQHLIEHTGQVSSLTLSPDGNLLASASGDQTIKLWNTSTWKMIATLRGHEHEVHGIAFSPDGLQLASSGKDETIRLWEVPTTAQTPGRPWPLARVPVLPQTPSAGRILDFDWNQGKATMIDVASATSHSHPLPPAFNRNTLLALSSDASAAAIALDNGSIELWETNPFRKLRIVAGSPSPVVAGALSADHRSMAIVRADGMTELWQLDPDRILEQLPPLSSPVTVPTRGRFHLPVSFCAEDQLLVRVAAATSATPDQLDIYHIPTRQHRLIRSSHKSTLSNFTISRDASLLATTAWDGTIKLWDIASGRELEPVRGQGFNLTSAAFSPDNTRLVAGGYDGSVTVWDLATLQQVATWKATRQHCFVVFADAGQLLLTAGESIHEPRFELTPWRAPSFDEIAALEARPRTPDYYEPTDYEPIDFEPIDYEPADY